MTDITGMWTGELTEEMMMMTTNRQLPVQLTAS
jgi:hypothetical protein